MRPWSEQPGFPRGPAAVLDALRFDAPAPLPRLTDAEWNTALAFSDRALLTLPLAAAAALPDPVRERTGRNLENNRRRLELLFDAWDGVRGALEAAGVPFAVLKGFSLWDGYTAAPELRVQYDLDLYAPHHARQAFDAIAALGYGHSERMRRAPVDHLPALLRQTGWRWKGDFFDPQIPIAVEVHYRLWDERTEGFPAPGLEAFWDRRVARAVSGRGYTALAPADALGYAALHAVRHLLRGEVRAGHVYELAWFLHHRREDDGFWTCWQSLHGAELRRLEAIALRLAREWFGCATHPIPGREIDQLPDSIAAWFARFAASPLEALFRPNKDELALHLCLIRSLGAKARVLRRRLLPLRLPHVPEAVGGRRRYVLERTRFHMRALTTLWRIR